MPKYFPRTIALARNVVTCAFVALALSVACNRTMAQSATAVRKDYTDVVETLRPFIQQQMAEKELPALSIAIIDDQQIVWAEGFGMADPKSKIPATADTVYLIGSVSKLLTDIAIMQLVERGELNPDAPVTDSSTMPTARGTSRKYFGTPLPMTRKFSSPIPARAPAITADAPWI